MGGKRKKNYMYGKSQWRENEKSTTRGIPRQSPIQVVTPPTGLNFGDRTRAGAFPVVWS